MKTQPGPIVGDPSAPVPATAQSDRLDPKRRRLGVLAQRWAAIWRPAGIFVASRVATIGAAAVAADLHPTFGLGGVLTRSWDGNWYRMLAEHGAESNIAE